MFLSEFSKANKFAVDYAGRIILNQNKEAIINFGKHKGQLVSTVFKKNLVIILGYKEVIFSKYQNVFYQNLARFKK